MSQHISRCGSEDIGIFVAMSAMDCFVASCPRADTRLHMTQAITIELNISNDKVCNEMNVLLVIKLLDLEFSGVVNRV